MTSDRTNWAWSRLGLFAGCVLAGIFLIGIWLPGGRAQQGNDQDLAVAAREILKTNCSRCHGTTKHLKGLNVLDRATLLNRPGKDPAVVPFKPDDSLLVKRIESASNPMPPDGDTVPDKDVKLLRAWIAAGAPDLTDKTIVTAKTAAEPAQTLEERVEDLFHTRCVSCHGGAKPEKGLRVLDHAALLQRALVVPKKPDDSPLLAKLQAADSEEVMPPNGRLAPEQIALVKDWIMAGAAAFDPVVEASPGQVGNRYVLEKILEDVRQLTAADQEVKSYRYFSLNHLLAGGVTRRQLETYRKALALTLNHLHLKDDLFVPQPLGGDPTRTIFRINVADLGWDTKPFRRVRSDNTLGDAGTVSLWDLILLEYPFGVMFDGADTKETYQALINEFLAPSGQVRPVAFVRADWFMIAATRAPLYEDLLRLPFDLDTLEKNRLRVTAATKENARRSGMVVSGVSRNNRVVERLAPDGANYYWKSYDFKTSKGTDNMFLNPVDLHQSGGEMIFALPNGFQAYYVCNARGDRLEAAPTEIVTDTNASDKIVRNGLSCMRCHDTGMRTFQDDVRPTLKGLETNPDSFDLQQALQLYPARKEMDGYVKRSADRFKSALARLFDEKPETKKKTTGGILIPVSDFYQEEKVTSRVAAAELGVADPEKIQGRFVSDAALALGLVQLGQGGAVRRDAWEENFDQVVKQMGLGKPIAAVDAVTRAEAQPTSAIALELTLNNPGKDSKNKLQVVVVNKTDPKRSVLAVNDRVEIQVLNNTDKNAFVEVGINSFQGSKAVFKPGRIEVKAGQKGRFPADAKNFILIQPGLGGEQWVVFASDTEFPPAEVLRVPEEGEQRGEVIADRIVHPFYELKKGEGLKVRGDPSRMVKKTLDLETR
jgi:mono/diheme cytochrome c family protein/cytochrome c553